MGSIKSKEHRMNIEFSGQYTEEVFFKAVNTISKPPAWIKYFRYAILGVYGVASVVMAVNAQFWADADGVTSNELFTYIVLPIAMLGLFVFFFRSSEGGVAKNLWKRPGIHHDFVGFVDDEGIHYTQPFEGFDTWETIKEKMVDPDFLAFKNAKNEWNFLQRSFFQNEEDFKQVCDTLDAKFVEKKK